MCALRTRGACRQKLRFKNNSGACKPVRGDHRLLLDASFEDGDTRTHTWPTNFCTTAAGDRTITPPLETDQPGKAKFAKVIVGVCVSLGWIYVCTLNKKSLYFCFFSRAAPLFFKRPIAKTPILHIIVGVTIGFDWLFLVRGYFERDFRRCDSRLGFWGEGHLNLKLHAQKRAEVVSRELEISIFLLMKKSRELKEIALNVVF